MLARASSAVRSLRHTLKNTTPGKGFCSASGIKEGKTYVPDGKKGTEFVLSPLAVIFMAELAEHRWSPNAGLKWVDDRLQSRITYGNYLAGFLAVVGGYVVYTAFNDPDSGKFEHDVAFSNWSATHSVKCKCAPDTRTSISVASCHSQIISLTCFATAESLVHSQALNCGCLRQAL